MTVGPTVIMMIGEEEILEAAGVNPEMTMTTEEAVGTVVHAPDLEIGTVGNVNSVISHPATPVINVMHPKMIIFLTQTEE